MSELVLEETRRNLLKISGEQALISFGLLMRILEIQKVPQPSKTQVVRVSKLVNLKDAPIVAAAARGKADYLVTHDKELLRQALEIQANFSVPVVSPGEILHLVRASDLS